VRGNDFDNRDFTDRVGDRQTFVEQRLRLDLRARASERAYGFVQIQDSRIWGEENPTDGDLATLSTGGDIHLHQAYFHVDELLGLRGLRLRAGRMELAYGSERLVGAEDWGNVGRSFNTVWTSLAPNPAYQLDLFAAKVVERDDRATDNPDNDTDFYGAYASFHPSGPGDWDAWFLYRRDVDPDLAATNAGRREELYTSGGRVYGEAGGWSFDAEASAQWGHVPVLPAGDSVHVAGDHRAGMLAATLGYRGGGPLTPHFTLGYERASGDSDPGDLESRAWIDLYPTRHDYLGFMDLLSRSNLTDFHGGLSLEATDRVHLAGAYHLFRLTESPESRKLGSELDVTLRFEDSDAWSVTLGYSAFFAGEVLDEVVTGTDPAAAGADGARYVYLVTSFGW
jgi:hypothetical protein